MNVGELKKALENMPEEAIVTVTVKDRSYFTLWAEEDLSVDTSVFKRELIIMANGGE